MSWMRRSDPYARFPMRGRCKLRWLPLEGKLSAVRLTDEVNALGARTFVSSAFPRPAPLGPENQGER